MNTTLTITADQRAPVYRQAIQHISGIGDVFGAYERGAYADAERFDTGLGEPEARRAEEEAAKVRAAYERTAEVCAELIATLDRDPGREG